ncbi:protein MCM10 homolog isoform X1 [Carcharodon carcharias]|uniref:protein MCM10 homolog isoform X1 n=1 Tax=Carcharodon carcharias TaxID=13397 RepID=UPI001B7F26BD|nr:protein MCM10 homolog isoform X1 [Carcharodon carcharias]
MEAGWLLKLETKLHSDSDLEDMDLLASLLDANEEEEIVESAGCSRGEQGSLDEDDEWNELFDGDEEDGAQAMEISALFGDVDDLEEEEEESKRSGQKTDQPSLTSDQKKPEKSKVKLEAKLEQMKLQMEKLQRQLAKVADGPKSVVSSGKTSPENKLKTPGKTTRTPQSIMESPSFQEALRMPSSNPKTSLLKTKLCKTQQPANPTAVTERSPTQIQPGNKPLLQPLKTSNKSNTTHQKLPATAEDCERPGTSRATNSNIAMDKFSGLRLRNPVVSSTEMERKMQGRKLIRLSQLRSKLASENLEDADWVTFAVVIKKVTPQSSNNGKTFSIWHLSDLRSSNLNLSLFLFGNVHKEHWKTETGTVIGLLNANPMKSRDGSDEVCLSVDHPQKILIMGEALDMGTCRARKKNGDPCTQIINLMDCEYCEYHVKAQYKKLSAKRADLQSSFSGRAPNKMQGKGGSLKARLCQQGFHYGGVSSASYAASAKAAGPNKSVQKTLTYMVVKGADDIVRETKKKIALANGKEFTGCSEDFKDLMEMPTFGARNLQKHLNKAPMKGGLANNAQPGPSILSISASELLKQQKHKMLESRKKRAEELQKRFMQSTSGSSSHTSGAGGLSSHSSLQVGAEFPKEQKLMATPQAPKLGRGFAEGEDILLFDSSPPSAPKLTPDAESKKMAAIIKLRKKGAILAKEDPNSVKRKLPDTGEMPAKVLEHIEKNLSSTHDEGNDEPTLKKHREQLEYLDSEEFQKILNARSRHVGAVQEVEAELQEQYFEPLVKKEQMEEKMKNIRELKCRVVSCKTCRYSYFKPLETCVSENHDYHWHDAIKRFFKCPCGNRAIALTRLPKKSCSNCGLFKWERDGMLKEKKGPKIGGELLLPRGEEHGKFLSSSK